MSVAATPNPTSAAVKDALHHGDDIAARTHPPACPQAHCRAAHDGSPKAELTAGAELRRWFCYPTQPALEDFVRDKLDVIGAGNANITAVLNCAATVTAMRRISDIRAAVCHI